MAQIFNLALRHVKSLFPFMGQAVKTDKIVIYNFPKVCDAGSKIVTVEMDDQTISVVTIRKDEDVKKSSPSHYKPHP